MKHVGFVTSAQFPLLTDSDSLLLEPLKKRGIEVVPIIWSSPTPSRSSLDAIVMRSAWDYHTNINEFKTFLSTLKKTTIPVYNPIDTMLWNSNKSYLFSLEKQGVSIVPTILLHSVDETEIQRIKKWSEIVIKPTVGASAYNILKIKTSNEENLLFNISKLLSSGSVIVQPFLNEIYDGEISFIFFDKQYSHAVLKKPKKNDFRTTNYAFGGTESLYSPSKQLIQHANKIIQTIKDPLLYARLDAIEVKGSLVLMELELIEPHLFFELSPEKASTFADAIARNV